MSQNIRKTPYLSILDIFKNMASMQIFWFFSPRGTLADVLADIRISRIPTAYFSAYLLKDDQKYTKNLNISKSHR